MKATANRPLSSWLLVAAICACPLVVAGSVFAEPPPKPRHELVLQAPPTASVTSVKVAPGGSVVAVASAEGSIRMHDARTGAMLRTIDVIGDRAVVFTPDGRRMAAGGFHMDKLVGICDPQTGKRTQTLAGHSEWEVYAMALSDDGKLLASSAADKRILVWDLTTGTLRHRIEGLAHPASALAFSPDGTTLASGAADRSVRLWSMETGELKRMLKGHGDCVSAIAFSPDGATIASASCAWGYHRGHRWPMPAGRSETWELRLWSAEDGTARRSMTGQGRMLTLAFAPDGETLACGIDQNVATYNLTRETPARIVASHDDIVTSVAFAPDGASILSGSHDQTAKRVSLSDGRTEWRAPGYFEQVNAVALSPDGSRLATSSSDARFASRLIKADDPAIGPGAIRLWDLRTGRLLHRLGDPKEQSIAAAFAPDGKLFVSGGGLPDGSGVVRVWDAATGALVWTQRDHQGEVLAAAFAPDGSRIATASADGAVKLRDAATGAASRTLEAEGRRGSATSVVFSLDGSHLASGDGYGAVRIWSVSTGRLSNVSPASRDFEPTFAEAIAEGKLLTSISVHPDGSTIAACASGMGSAYGESMRFLDLRTGAPRSGFAAKPIAGGRPATLSHNGAILATGGKSVKLWDPKSGAMLRELYGHLKRTQSLAFSADDRLVVSGGSYGTVNLWRVDDGRLLVTLFAFAQTQNGAVSDQWLAYHPEGFYDGSDGIDRFVSWRVGDELLTPATLGAQLRKPERIQAALTLDPAPLNPSP